MSIFLLNSLNSWFCLFVGFLANIFLLNLARKYSQGELQEFRPVVNYFCGLNLLLLIFHALIQPIFFISDELTAYIFVQGIVAKIESILIRHSLVQCFLFLLFKEMTGLGCQFFGRYLALTRSIESFTVIKKFIDDIPNFGSRKCRFCVLAIGNSIFFLVPIILGLFSTTIPGEEKFIDDLIFREKNTSETFGGQNWTNSPKIGMKFDMQNSILDQFIRIWIFSGFIICYLSVIICYIQIRIFMQKHLMDFGNSRKRNIICQISKNMILQAFLPLCSLTLNSFLTMLMIFGHYSPKLIRMELLSFLPLNWLPVLNPLVTIFTILDFRIGAAKELSQWRIGRRRNGSNESGIRETDGEKTSLKSSDQTKTIREFN